MWFLEKYLYVSFPFASIPWSIGPMIPMTRASNVAGESFWNRTYDTRHVSPYYEIKPNTQSRRLNLISKIMQAKPRLIGIRAPAIKEKTIIEFILWGMTTWFMKRSIKQKWKTKRNFTYILLKISVKITSSIHCNVNWTHIQPLILKTTAYIYKALED